MKKTFLLITILLLGFSRVANSQEAKIEVLPGVVGNMHVTVDLSGFADAVGAITMKIGFDPNVVAFTGVSYGSVTNGINANVLGNEIIIAWSSTNAITATSTTTAFMLDFVYTSGSCELTFNNGCEISNSEGVIIQTTFTNGAIQSPAYTSAVIDTLVGVFNDINHVPITFGTSTALNDIGAVTLIISYDNTKLQFIGLDGLDGATVNDLDGEIHVAWSSEAGINLSGSSNVVLNFNYLGGSSDITFTGPNIISRINGNPIGINFINGRINQPTVNTAVVQISNTEGNTDGVTEVPIVFSGFIQNQGAISMHIAYNPGVLNFIGTSLSGANANAENGIITLMWSNPSGVMIPSFNLLFNYLGGSCNAEFIGLNEISDNTGEIIPVTYFNGAVLPHSATVNVSLGNVYLVPGNSMITVPINFSGIVSSVHAATMYVDFDQTKLTFIGVENAPSGTVANQDPSTKTIIITWANPSGAIANPTVFLNLKFEFTGGAYNCSVPIYFTTYTSNASMLANGSGGNLLANWEDGSVNLKVLNLTLFLEGLYNGVGMRQAQNATGPQWGLGIADKIIVELHSASSSHYSDILYTSPLTELSTSGQATIVIPTNLIGSYYITIKHRNSIETTTAAPVSFENCATSYNFSTSVSQAYGDNMKDIAGVSVLYCGDFTSADTPYPLSPIQDGVIDDSDYYDAYYSVLNGDSGYLPQDIDGNGWIRIEDVDMIFENYAAGITSILPEY